MSIQDDANAAYADGESVSKDEVRALWGKARATNDKVVDLEQEVIATGVTSRDSGADLELAQDSDGNLYRRVDADGNYYIPNIEGPLQDQFLSRTSERGATNPGGDIEQVLDSGGENLVRRVDSRGALHVPADRGHVQHHLRRALAPAHGQFETPVRTLRDVFPAAVRAKVAERVQDALPFIEPPALLVPNGYDVPDALLTNISISDDNPVAQLPFPYTDGGSVHPYVLPLRQPLYGYRFLITDSNHKNGTSAEETPVMFGTNDFATFDLVPDVPQPMVNSSPGTDGRAYDGFCSDPFFAYDPTDGALIWGTRDTVQHPVASNDFVMVKTYDGVNWTPHERITSPSGSGLSPSILYDFTANQWHMWIAPNEGTLAHFTGPSYLGPWTQQSSTNFNTTHSIDIWHMEVKYLGGRFALCCCSRDSGTDTEAQVYLGLSADGDTWVMSPGLVQPQSADIYKPTFFPEFDGQDRIRLTFLWAHWDWVNQTPPDDMQLYLQRTSWVDLTTL